MGIRYILFIVFAILIFLVNALVVPRFFPAPPAPRQVAQREAVKPVQGDEKQPLPGPNQLSERAERPNVAQAEANPAVGPASEQKPGAKTVKPAVFPAKWATLGSLDPKSPYRMLVTLTSRGAAVERIELNSPNYRDMEDRSGYLGHLSGNDEQPGAEAVVRVVGPGTPAAKAGLQSGDLIEAVNGKPVSGFPALRRLLADMEPGQTVILDVVREGKSLKLPVTLEWRPMEVVRPENDDPLSLLTTLHRIDDFVLPPEDTKAAPEGNQRNEKLFQELEGVDLRSANWEVVQDPAPSPDRVSFRRELPRWGLRITKTYRLAKDGSPEAGGPQYGAAYHLVFEIKIENASAEPHLVAYQLDGPTGLPTEGAWYASKVGPGWGAYGLRDVAVDFEGSTPNLYSCQNIAAHKTELWTGAPLRFIGVDAQYFSTILIPQRATPEETWFALSRPLRVGAVDPQWTKMTDVSFRAVSTTHKLAPNEVIENRFTIFAGPKQPALLAQYGLEGIVYYGWFWWVAIPMQWVLHFFHNYLVFNYGLAIILLTVVVRAAMFPISRKQAANARKMQELQPELKKIAEKYKKDLEGRTRAQQELFKKHNYHPLAGCWVIFLQLPIFVGLYRALMVDVELRQAPLISASIRWASNLAAPDMLFDWSHFWSGLGWEWFNRGQGMFALGPYFNILPIIAVALMILQQKMIMPPPADEQAALQQKMMNFMMVFFGVMFYRVASGLCLYFIATSLWSFAERKLLPPTTAPAQSASSSPKAAETRSSPLSRLIPQKPSNGSDRAAQDTPKKKRRPRK